MDQVREDESEIIVSRTSSGVIKTQHSTREIFQTAFKKPYKEDHHRGTPAHPKKGRKFNTIKPMPNAAS